MTYVVRGLFGGSLAVILVVSIFAFRMWWTAMRGAPGGVGICISPMLKPEVGLVMVATFALGFWLARFIP
jgi:hypothetical protein